MSEEIPEKPAKHKKRYGFSTRSEKERNYENKIDLALLVQDPRIQKKQENALKKAFQLLYDAELIESKSQFSAGVLQMVQTPLEIKEVAGILGVTRQTLRNMERDGKITMYRPGYRRVFVRYEDVVRMLEGRG